jgi:hypothetical protein
LEEDQPLFGAFVKGVIGIAAARSATVARPGERRDASPSQAAVSIR